MEPEHPLETEQVPSEPSREPVVPLCDVSDHIESQLVLGLLRSEGIEALSSSDLDPSIWPVGSSEGAHILVLEHDLEKARRVLAEHRLSTFAVGVVLAAGAGTRMGMTKGLLSVRGKTLVEQIVETYSASSARDILVVVAPDSPVAERIDTDSASVVINPDPSRGPLSSLQAALEQIKDSADALLLHPVDVPVFDSDLIDDLIRRYDAGEGPILVPTFKGRRGHPVLFGKECFPALLQASPRIGAREVLHQHPEWVREVPTGLRWVTTDLNTPAELELFISSYQSEVPGLE